MFSFRRQNGAAAVEFALLLPILVVLAFGITQLSTAYNRQQGMHAAVREGARLAASGGTTGTGAALADVRARIVNELKSTQGFEAGDVEPDLVVELYEMEEADVAANNTGTTTAMACDESADHYAVRVVGRITDARTDYYGITIPLVPGSPFALSFRSSAVFRCLN